jgi:hypothetical protein
VFVLTAVMEVVRAGAVWMVVLTAVMGEVRFGAVWVLVLTAVMEDVRMDSTQRPTRAASGSRNNAPYGDGTLDRVLDDGSSARHSANRSCSYART